VAPIWLTEAEVVSLVDMGEAIRAVERGLAAEAAGAAGNLLKTHLSLPSAGGRPNGSLHSLGGSLAAADVVGVKSWAHTPGGATPLLILWRASDGSLLAVIEAFALGQYRTAAIAGAATHALARPDSARLAILGSGHQALTQAAAVAGVRRLSHIAVWSPTAEHRTRFADQVGNALGIEASAAASVAKACDGADVVTTVTRATTPFLAPEAVGAGTHINAMGAIAPDRAEFDPKLLQRCALVVADSVPQARALSREFGEFYGEDDAAWGAVSPLSAVAGETVRRPDDADLTLFKAMGVGLADVSIGLFLYEQALENRLGTPLSAPAPSRPRLRSNISRPGAGYV
jgi:ornithine cyclodeaminase